MDFEEVLKVVDAALDLESAFKLHSMGLVMHRYENQVIVRCDLYRRYFYNRLGQFARLMADGPK